LTSELKSGSKVGPYRIESILGEGGMGVVYRAVTEANGEIVALKVLKSQLAADQVYRQRFVHEARAAGEVSHPNLVSIMEAGEADGLTFLAVRYVAGSTLAKKISAAGTLPIDEILLMVTEIGAALDALHAAGVVHRDIKPSNIIVDDKGAAMLTDFGLAKGRAYTVLTKQGQVMGTLDYLAPEAVRGKPATPASDIYSLGCVVFECLAGQTLFAGKRLFEVGMAHIQEPPPDPCTDRFDLPAAFCEEVLHALEKDPERRPSSAGEYARLLKAAAGQG
jgi:serine/threonine protein kinase